MKRINNKRWLMAAGTRAAKTMFQTMATLVGLSSATILEQVNWQTTLSAGLLSGVLSMLTSLAGMPEVKEEVKEEAE